MASVTIENLSKKFGSDYVINQVSLDVKEGEFLTLLGPSGCGKTTTLRVVAGFLSPDRGQVSFNGEDVTHVPTQRRQLGMVFQDYALFPHLTVAENVGFALKACGTPKADISSRVKQLLDLIRLPAAADKYPAQMSGGQQQRVAIARALARTPTVLLMDEPLGALDLKLREAMQAELHAIQRHLGITTIYVTHDQEEALSLSDRIALMRSGKIEQLDVPKDIYCKPATPFSAFFLGKINFFKGKVVGREGSNYVVDLATGRVKAPVGGSPEFNPGTNVLVAVRPEHLRLNRKGIEGEVNALSGSIVREKFTGKVLQHEVEVDRDTFAIIDGTVEQPMPKGQAVEVIWEVAATNIYSHRVDPEIGVLK